MQLIVLNGFDEGKKYQLEDGEIKVGSQSISKNSISIKYDDEISKQAFLLNVSKNKVKIKDSKDSKMIYVNNIRIINEKILKVGDVIKVGSTLLCLI